MPPPILAFDIETIPDVHGIRQLHNLPATLSDAETVDIARRLLRQERGHDFFPLPLQRIVVISCVLRRIDTSSTSASNDEFKVFSLPTTDPTSESDAIDQFYRLLEKHQPVLVSWNGGGFDLPVLQYRAMFHRLRSSIYWKTDGDFKWNNYTSRFHERHTDLMDVLALYQPRANARLNDVAVLCGLPGKIGIGGGAVWQTWQNGEIDSIRRYCEHDALLTYLLYARHQHCRGRLDGDEEEKRIRQHLQSESERWNEFLTQWDECAVGNNAGTTPASNTPNDGLLI